MTCQTDVPEPPEDPAGGVDVPLPDAEGEVVQSSLKRRRDPEDGEGDEERVREDRADDPGDLQDGMVGCVQAPHVLMLGEKRNKTFTA